MTFLLYRFILLLVALGVVYLVVRGVRRTWRRLGVKDKLEEVTDVQTSYEKVKDVSAEEVKQQKQTLKDFEDL